jgi:hypothetical protein
MKSESHLAENAKYSDRYALEKLRHSITYQNLHESDNCDHFHDAKCSFDIGVSLHAEDIDNNNTDKEYSHPDGMTQRLPPILKRD